MSHLRETNKRQHRVFGKVRKPLENSQRCPSTRGLRNLSTGFPRNETSGHQCWGMGRNFGCLILGYPTRNFK